MNEYGVIYMAWGQNAIDQAKQSIGSLRRFLPKMPVAVVGDDHSMDAFGSDESIETIYCSIDPFDRTLQKGYRFLAGRIKPLLYALSPFEHTLYVDADTYFQRSPKDAFRVLDQWDVALAETQTRCLNDGVAGKEECAATAAELGSGLLLYHNSGMIFWKKNDRTKALFDLWREEWERFGGWDEQVALLRALLRSDVLFLTLPYTWNHSGLSECYLLTHWFGAGDARIDMKQRNRQVELSKPRPKPPTMIKIDLGHGQYVQCRPEHEDKVRRMYGLDVSEQLLEEVEEMRRRNDNPLVKVPQGRPGEYVKMRKKDAERLGLPWEYEKGMAPEGNKIFKDVEDKGDVDDKSGSPEPDTSVMHPEGASPRRNDKAVDFTEISGVGEATAEKIVDQGIRTFEELKDADLDFLSGRARKAVERWRKDRE